MAIANVPITRLPEATSPSANDYLILQGESTQKIKWSVLLDKLYPVGCIYQSASPTSPASFLGGTWERIKDKFILAAGDTYAAGSTGGSANHNHSIGEMFAAAYINGSYMEYHYSGNTGWTAKYKNLIPNGITETSLSDKIYRSGITVYGSPTKEAGTLPPYVAMYVWKRIS